MFLLTYLLIRWGRLKLKQRLINCPSLMHCMGVNELEDVGMNEQIYEQQQQQQQQL